jgi:hypothetical protein
MARREEIEILHFTQEVEPCTTVFVANSGKTGEISYGFGLLGKFRDDIGNGAELGKDKTGSSTGSPGDPSVDSWLAR